MAIDTLVKRRSAINVGSYWRDLLLTPTGTDATIPAERYTLAGVYAGFASQWAPVPPGPGGSWSNVAAGPSGGWTDVPAGPSGGWVNV